MSVAGYVTDTTYNLNSFCPPGNGGTEGGYKTIDKNPKADKTFKPQQSALLTVVIYRTTL